MYGYCSHSFNHHVDRYDDHRDQILRSSERHQAGGGGGGYDGGGGGGKPPEDEELFQFFSSSCYSGYGDGPKVCAALCVLASCPCGFSLCRASCFDRWPAVWLSRAVLQPGRMPYAANGSCCAVQGFYGVYETLFAKLAKQEREAWERRDAGGYCLPGRVPHDVRLPQSGAVHVCRLRALPAPPSVLEGGMFIDRCC